MDGIADPPTTAAHVPLDLIDSPSSNCRAVAGDVEDLARSIRIHGVLSPLRLRPVAGGRYEVVAGERRWRAAQLAGLTEVPAAIDHSLDEVERLSAQLAENVDRLELTQLERVQAIQQLLEHRGLSLARRGATTRALPRSSSACRWLTATDLRTTTNCMGRTLAPGQHRSPRPSHPVSRRG